MKIALIITDEYTENRSSLLVALELDERITHQGFSSQIIDLSDRSYDFMKTLPQFDGYIFIGNHKGPLYNPGTHQLLTNFRSLWRKVRIGSIIISNEPVLARSADLALNNALKVMGANPQGEQLIVLQPENKFDSKLNLKDAKLNLAFDQFLFEFIYGTNGEKKAEEQLIA